MNPFDEMVRPSLVRIAAPGGGYDPHGAHYWGSGFFIAPGWVLTCAHVVGKGEAAVWRGERALGITWQGGVTTGEVVLAKPRPADPEEPPYHWEFPDIALVRVPDARDAACVWLGERPPAVPADVSLHGWSRETGDLGIRHGVGRAHATDGKALLLRGSLPVEGCSGGPVVDLVHGAVIGMNKGRAEHEGAAVPITALRDLHDLPGGGILTPSCASSTAATCAGSAAPRPAAGPGRRPACGPRAPPGSGPPCARTSSAGSPNCRRPPGPARS